MREFAFQLGALVIYAATLAAAIYLGAKISKTTGRGWLGIVCGVLIFGVLGTLLALQGLPTPSGYGYSPDD